jgi:hypothetical protein
MALDVCRLGGQLGTPLTNGETRVADVAAVNH